MQRSLWYIYIISLLRLQSLKKAVEFSGKMEKRGGILLVSWFKRWLGKGDHQRISLEDMTCSIDVLSESVSKNEIGLQKGLRRLSMAQKQQSDTLALLAQESASLKFVLNERHGLILTYEQILQILDNLSKIDQAAGNVTYPNGSADRARYNRPVFSVCTGGGGRDW
ncbi:MAG: hypothetical protein ACI9Y1_002251 [Lentisphaeria bacterium]|jgi:hypothetical protein